MWSIIKAELSYNRIFLVSLYFATLGIWVIYLFDPAGIFQLFIPGLFLMIALFTGAAKEKRERLHALLPIPLKHRSLAGLLSYAILFHAGILSAWTTQFLRERGALANEFITFWGVLALNGLAISIVFIVVIRYDLKCYNEKKYRRIADAVLWIVLVTMVLFFVSFKIMARQDRELHDFVRDLVFYSPVVAVATNLICAGLMRLSTAVYAGRKSYLA